jgi:hypothetical protein
MTILFWQKFIIDQHGLAINIWHAHSILGKYFLLIETSIRQIDLLFNFDSVQSVLI